MLTAEERRARNKVKCRSYYQKNRDRILAKNRGKPSTPEIKEYQRNYRAKTPIQQKNYDLSRYGITLDQYQQLYLAQNGVCAICRTPEKTIIRGKLIRMAVDHCHITGKVRSLLCMNCNMSLGLLKESADIALRMVAYIQSGTREAVSNP